MNHLSPDTFVDLLDGTLSVAAVPHLDTCAQCRRELAELRATWRMAVDTEVPEPSPLYWDHLSSRISRAVAAEPVERRDWWRIDWSWRSVGLAGAALAAAVLLMFVQVSRRGPVPVTPAVATTPVVAPAAIEDSGDVDPLPPLADDESIGLMADLASDLDWDGVAELGLTAQGGTDRAVADLTPAERDELGRLLVEAVGTM